MEEQEKQMSANSEPEEDTLAPKKEAGRKKSKEKAGEVKTRLTLVTPVDHPFTHFLTEVKDRGIKNFDPATLILEALDKIDEDWWDEKLEEMTPLEFKLTAALNDPKMREKLTSLLANQKLPTDSSSSSLQ